VLGNRLYLLHCNAITIVRPWAINGYKEASWATELLVHCELIKRGAQRANCSLECRWSVIGEEDDRES
jgi:hypothetical protein